MAKYRVMSKYFVLRWHKRKGVGFSTSHRRTGYKYITVSTHKNKKLAKKALAKIKRLEVSRGESGRHSKIVKV